MKFTIGAAFADAAALWRGEHDLLLRVAGVFFFLPAFGFGMLTAQIDLPEKPTPEQLEAAIMALVQTNFPWVVASAVIQAFGALTILLLLLARDRPTAGDALARSVRLFPGYLVTAIVSQLLMALGMLMFVVPGIYAVGRTFLSGPAYAVAPEQGAVRALEQGVRLSVGRGWMLASLWVIVTVASYLVLAVLGDIAGPDDGGANPVIDILFRIAVAAVGAVLSLALTLLQVAAYRLLAPRQGI